MTIRITVFLAIAMVLQGCASSGIYAPSSNGNKAFSYGVSGAAAGALVGALTGSSRDLRGSIRQGAAYGAVAGVLYGLGEQQGIDRRSTASRSSRVSRSRYRAQRYQQRIRRLLR